MLAGNEMHACPEVSRRAFFATVLGVTATQKAVAQSVPPGFEITGVVSESQEPDCFYLGIQFGLIAAPRTEPHRYLKSKVGTQVRVHVEGA